MALAKWYKIDFHTHTPASNCFPDKSITAIQWLEAAKQSGMNAVVITDHNSVSFLKEIELVKNNYEEENIFKVFYGIELCVSAEFTHIIILFDDKLTLTQIEDAIIGDLNLNREDWNNTEKNVSEDRLENLCNRLRNHIFVIPAHFASNKGLGKAKINAIKKYKDFIKFSAVEVRNNEDLSQYNNKLQLEAIYPSALISGSDNPSNCDESQHSIEGFGKQYTWVKLSQLNFDGLKQVFIDFEYRCINTLDLEKLGKEFDPNNVNHNFISGVQLKGFKHLANLDFRFSPYLNCIIGGRGTGKSTVIEALHICLNQKADINDSTIIKSTLQKDGQINTFYNFGSNQNYKISASKKNPKTLTFQFENDDGLITDPPEFAVDFYGQKDIFGLIEEDDNVSLQNESTLVNLIDGKLDTRIYSINDNILEISTQLIQFSEQYSNNRVKIYEISTVRAEINKLDSILIQYKESGLDYSRANYDRMNKLFEICKNALNDGSKYLSKLMEELLSRAQEINEVLAKEEEQYESYKEISEIMAFVKDAYISVFNTAKEKQSEMQIHLIEFVETELFKDANNAKVQYDAALEKVKNTGSENLKVIQDKLQSYKIRELQLLNVKHEQENLGLSMKNKINDLVKKRLELTSLRAAATENSSISSIIISIMPLGHKNRWKQKLQHEFGKENTFDTIFDDFVDFVLDPHNDFQNYKNYIYYLLTSSDGDLWSFYEKDIKELRFLKLWEDKQKNSTLNSLLKIMPEDLITIKIIEGAREIDINEGSPGQKSAAILAFILSSGENPLIIDQPEDDLDNSLINTLIVKSIRQVKSKRQIIIVTHNANIPVLGDAEGIIILERNKDGKVALRNDKKAGCLEEELIREGICTIMEGGEDAFKKREEKYLYK